MERSDGRIVRIQDRFVEYPSASHDALDKTLHLLFSPKSRSHTRTKEFQWIIFNHLQLLDPSRSERETYPYTANPAALVPLTVHTSPRYAAHRFTPTWTVEAWGSISIQ